MDDVTRDEAVCAAVRREMRQRGYDDHAADDAVFEEGVADIAKAAVDALIAAGWGDLTAERERLAAEAPVVTQYTAAGVALAAASGTDVAWICVDDVRDAFTALAADRDALRARLTAERERLAAAVEAARCDDEGCADYRDGLDAAARLIRTTTEEADRG